MDKKQELIGVISEYELKEIFSQVKLGFEKECLRVADSSISNLSHPHDLGSPLCNEHITTDFSEAQLELITPPLKGSHQSLEFLDNIHHFVSLNIKDEILWPLSFPPPITYEDDIRIAKYGSSNLGVFKEMYRKGLAKRYGKSMQAISGFHFNYSLPTDFWESLIEVKKDEIIQFRSEIYLNILRNIFRLNWLILYFFGASPIVTKSFLNKGGEIFQKFDEDSFYLPYATSLRMSDYGYCNSGRSSTYVSLNTMDSYISDLRLATITQDDNFKNVSDDFKSQLNANTLQIEDEYYAVARAKSNHYRSRRTSTNLSVSGIDFIEIRSLDLNPFYRNGIDSETIVFLKILLLYSLREPSELINKDELEIINRNDSLVSKYGRKPNLKLIENNKEIFLKDWGLKILDQLLPIAEEIDDQENKSISIINSMKSKLNDSSQTLSGIMMDRLIYSNSSYTDFGNSIGAKNKNYYLGIKESSNPEWGNLQSKAIESRKEQKRLEQETQESGLTFERYKADYFND